MKELIEDVILDLMLDKHVDELKIELCYCEECNVPLYIHLLKNDSCLMTYIDYTIGKCPLVELPDNLLLYVYTTMFCQDDKIVYCCKHEEKMLVA